MTADRLSPFKGKSGKSTETSPFKADSDTLYPLYAKTREECEILLAELIKEMKAEIQAERERIKQEQSM